MSLISILKNNVDASSHVTRVQNTLRTEIESWKDVESLFDEIGHKTRSNLYYFFEFESRDGSLPSPCGIEAAVLQRRGRETRRTSVPRRPSALHLFTRLSPL